jgi:hypothetical protein
MAYRLGEQNVNENCQDADRNLNQTTEITLAN